MGRSSTTFSSENQPKTRTPRGPCKKNIILNAIREEFGSEQEYAKQVVRIGVEEKNSTLITHVIEQIQPKNRPTLPTVKFTFDPKDSPVKQALNVFQACSKGDIPPDTAKVLVDTIGVICSIDEHSDMKEEFEMIKGMVHAIGNPAKTDS